MHPYRAVTDEHGVAHVRVAKGLPAFRVADQVRHVRSARRSAADMTARAELFLEPVGTALVRLRTPTSTLKPDTTCACIGVAKPPAATR